MLVLSRKVGQKLKIGPKIVITVVRNSGGNVRLGIDAPSNVVILREEVADRDANPPKP